MLRTMFWGNLDVVVIHVDCDCGCYFPVYLIDEIFLCPMCNKPTKILDFQTIHRKPKIEKIIKNINEKTRI